MSPYNPGCMFHAPAARNKEETDPKGIVPIRTHSFASGLTGRRGSLQISCPLLFPPPVALLSVIPRPYDLSENALGVL